MKNILFICGNMEIGGVQKSLVSLLQHFDYRKYNVDLLLFVPEGPLMRYIPSEVNLVQSGIDSSYYKNFKNSLRELCGKKKYGLATRRIVGTFISVFNKGQGFVFSNKAFPKLVKYYDAAIDYGGQVMLYYLVDKVNANVKISYFHNDYKKWNYYEKTDRKYYKYVNDIVTVSDECVTSMKKVFPEYQDKIYCIENIIDGDTTRIEPDTPMPNDNFNGIRIVTIGRVCEQKGFDFAVQVASRLILAGYEFRWYWVGPYSNDDPWVKKVAQDNNLKNYFILVGGLSNPYGYMTSADIYVQPARFEGKSIAIEEAKVLNIPIVTTNFSTVKNQITNDQMGIVCDINVDSIEKGVVELINNQARREDIRRYLKDNCHGNGDEVKKLYRLIEG